MGIFSRFRLCYNKENGNMDVVMDSEKEASL